MRLWFTLLFFCLFTAQLLHAQQSVPVELQGTKMRKELILNNGQLGIELCGLTPGFSYTVFVNPVLAQQTDQFQIFPGKAPNGLNGFEPTPGRTNAAKFKADAACVKLVSKLVAGKQAENQHFVLTIICIDCPEDETWKEHFLNGVEMANINTTGSVSASSLVTNTLIGGNCFQVTNITSAGSASSRGTFTNGATSIGIANGVVLCTGNVNTVHGPNNAGNAGGGFNNNSADDVDLATLSTGNQWDVSKIEFDFTPTTNKVEFQFVFGSEEYCEFVGSGFNDVFGFFISGPGIAGTQNIALIPSTSTPVAINNVNHNTNTTFYVNNNNNNAACNNLGAFNLAECQLDGWTTVLTATTGLQACGTYHIKLAIADIGDAAYASAVFLKANSFDAGGIAQINAVYPAGQTFVYEDCLPGGFIRFVRGNNDLSMPFEVNFTIAGTATAGDDYAPITSPVIIPAGQSEILIPVTAFGDLIVEGDETIEITLSNPCTCNQQPLIFTIKDNLELEVTMDDVTLCGGSNTSLSPTITGGVPPYTYLWNTGATTSSINITTPGTNTYTVRVTDKCGTSQTVSAVVSLVPQPTANLTGSGFFCAGSTTPVNLNLTLTGIGPWEVTYNAGGNQVTETFNTTPAVIVATEPGVYNLVSVESGNGCTGTVTGSVTLADITITLTQTPTNPPCFGINNGTITSTASGGSAPFTYLWSNNANTPNLSNLGPNTYSVTVTNGNGCTTTNEITLTAPPELTANIVGSLNIDCNNPQGNADLEVGGGTPSYDFLWSNSSTQEDPVFTAGGNYTVTVTDDNNCTITASVTIAANTTLPTAVIAPPAQVTCANPELTLNATGSSQGSNFTYAWSGPGFVCCETTLEPQINTGGLYVLTVTNTDNGCTRAVSVNVVQNNTPPNVNINTPANIGCTTPTITLNGNGTATGAGISYQWTTSGGNFVCCTNTLNPQVNQAGTYTLLVTNSNNGCTNEETVTVSGDIVPPVATIAPPNVVNCFEPEITLDASGSSQGGNFTYNWSGPAGGINSGGNTLNPSVDLAGTYILTVTNADNNCTATASVTVTLNQTLPTAVATSPGILNCTVIELTLSGVGSSSGPNFEYEWTTNGGNFVSGETTLNPVIDQPGIYLIQVTDLTNGCTRIASVAVNQNITPPNVNINTPANIGCNMPVVTLNGSGTSTGANFTYLWTTTDGNLVCCTTTLNPQVNAAGTYNLVVTNTTNGCTNEETVTVSGNTILPVAEIAPPITVDCNNPEITLDGSGSSQNGNFVYNWSGPSGGINGGGNTLNPSVDQPGTYTLTVTDADNNCTATATVTVVANLTQPVAVAATPPTLTCQNPQLTLNGTGSSTGSNFTYEWTTGNGNIVSDETTLNPVIDQPGAYTLVVTNTTNGCTRSVTVTVNANQNFPIASAGPSLELNCLFPTRVIQGSGSLGNGFSFQWIPNPGNIVSGANTYTPTVNQAGFYTLLVTNTANGCTSEDIVEITENFNTPEALIAPPEVLTCATPEINLDATGSSQGGNYTYTWSSMPAGGIISGGNTDNPTVNKPGTYKLTITDTESGCTATSQVVVTQDITPPVANAGPGGQLSCQMPTLILSGTGSTGPDFAYEWSTTSGNILSGENTLSPEINEGGQYRLVVINTSNGCTAQSTVNITVNQNFPNAVGGPDLELNCQNNGIVELNGTGTSTGSTYTYQWTANPGNIVSGGNTLKPKVNEAGFYTLLVTNTANGCTDEAEVFVADNIIYPVPLIAPPQELNCNFTTVELDANGSTYSAAGAFQWTTVGGNILNGANTLTPEINQPGTYKLVITNQDNFCTATLSVVVTKNITAPAATAVANGILTCQFPQLELNGTGSSQGPEFFYVWTTQDGNIVSGNLTLNPTVSEPGVYQLLVSNNDNGCTQTAAVTVTTSQVFPQANAGAPSDLTCAIGQITLNGISSSQGNEYAYVWSTPNGNIVSGANTLTPVVNAPGVYDLSVVNLQNGCTTTASVVIGTNYTNPVAVVAPAGILSCSQPSLSLNGTGSSTGSIFTYNWSSVNGNFLSGQTTLNPLVNATGVYDLVVTNTVNGCTTTASTTVIADASVPTAIAGIPNTLTCTVDKITLNGTSSSAGSSFIYQWTGPGILSGDNTLTPVVDKPGLYELQVTNTTNGCTALSAVTIPQDIVLPIAEAGPGSQLDCDDLTITLQGGSSSIGPMFVYDWSTLNGYIVSGANTLTPTITEPGLYKLITTNVTNGCLSSDSVVITQDVVFPVADAGTPGLITCTNPTVTLGASGSTGTPFTYTWTTADGNIAIGSNTLNPVVDAPGTYNLLITNVNNACTASDMVVVNKDANVPIATANVTGELNCVVQELTLNGGNSTQGSTIITSWTTPDGNIVSGANGLSPVVDAPGVYTLNIFNTANNCKAISTVNVNLNITPPVANAGTPAVISCLNPILTLNGNGSSQGSQYTYNWETLNGQILNGGTTLTPQIDQSGFYTIAVTDQSNGCTATSTVQIIRDQNTPEADAGPTPTLTCTVLSLDLNGSASSAGPQFAYNWNTPDGLILLGANTLTPTVGAPGTYQLTVSNAQNGCSAIASVVVNENITLPIAEAGASPTLTCAVTSLQLDGAGSSPGANQVSYLWTTTNGQIISGNNTLNPTIGDPGSYQLLVTDLLNGCTQTDAVEVLEDITSPLAASAVVGEITCSVKALPLSGTGSSTGSNFVYQWTTANGKILDGDSTLTPNVNKAGTYNLLVTNTITGCTETASVTVTQNIIPPTVDAGATSQLTCAVTSLSLSGTANGGINGVSYAWTGPGILSGNTTPDPLINVIGTYYLTATDLYNGCTAKDSVKILPNTTAPTIAIANPEVLTCKINQLYINAVGTSTGAQYSYSWSGPGLVSGSTSLTPLVEQPGTYQITVSNNLNGCTSVASATVTQNVLLPIAEAGNGFELTCSINSDALSANGSSNGANFAYQWGTTDGNILSGANTDAPIVSAVGTYQLTVTNLSTGCTAEDATIVTRNTNFPSDILFSSDPPACGNQLGSIVFEEVTGGVGPYLYSIDGGNQFLSASDFTQLKPGTYQLVVQDVNGCEYDETLVFPVPLEPQVDLPGTIALAFGESATLTANLNIPLQEIDTIIWSPMNTLTLTNKPNVVLARPFSNTEYTVLIINKDGCEDRAKILVGVSDPDIWAPNVINPDLSSNENNVFLLFAREKTVKRINSLQIYDRWGTQIFQVKDILPNVAKSGWDGTFQGQPLNPAVFVWWAEVELESGQKLLMKGDVTIVR
ncbi:MAG: choice-of-anchor L domain-containing protein [Saprospiraceae bacterium]|nr:choice-of-anchor L domain-containing protein [Saprospiraceae bacterium]